MKVILKNNPENFHCTILLQVLRHFGHGHFGQGIKKNTVVLDVHTGIEKVISLQDNLPQSCASSDEIQPLPTIQEYFDHFHPTQKKIFYKRNSLYLELKIKFLVFFPIYTVF